MKRPNFILFMTDQHRADHLGCYGNEIVRTPHIDSLARSGTQLSNFFVNCPICMPNRIAMMTGRLPSVNGSRHNGIPLSRDAVTYVDLLRSAGYKTALIGKGHLQDMTDKLSGQQPRQHAPHLQTPPEELSDASRERRIGPKYQDEMTKMWASDPTKTVDTPYYGFDYVRFANGHGDQVHGHYDRWLEQNNIDATELTGWQNALPSQGLVAPQAWRTAMPEEYYPTSYVESTTREYIEKFAKGDQDEPFFIQCSFPDPHHPFTPPGKYFDMYDPKDIPLPKSFNIVGENEHPYLKELRAKAQNGTSNDSGPPPFAITDETAAKQIIALTYGMITMVDDAIGRILESVEKLGLKDDTVIVFTSDHGDFMGDHGLMLKHGLHYDGVLHVPFIWSDPSDDAPQNSDPLGSSIDIGTTVLARAGLAPPNGNQGFDLLGDPQTTGIEARKGVIVEEDELGVHLASENGLRTRTFVNKDWRLTIWDDHESGELFDRKDDPFEINNLWDSADHLTQKNTLIEQMLREIIRLNDTAPLTVHVA